MLLSAVSIVVVLGLNDAFGEADISRPDGAIGWLIVIGPALPIPFRRVFPTAAVVTGGLLQVVMWSTSLPDFYLAMAVLLYSAAAFGGLRGRRASWIMSAALTLFTAIGVLTGEAPFYAVPIVGLFSVAASAMGASVANRQAYIEQVEARASETERSRLADHDRALTEERNRIARELHDVVAHGLSVVVVQAAAAQRILDRDPSGARSALEQIEQTGRTALGEMRQVLSVIRTDPAESWRPAPGLAGLDELVDELGKTGLMVTLSRSGTIEQHPLPVTIDMTAYRIVQESLTNVLKHGGRGARASVDIQRTESSLDLAITDDGRGAAAAERGGHGLRGMQERVEVFGGDFSAGPARGGGFAVKVSLPIEATGSR